MWQILKKMLTHYRGNIEFSDFVEVVGKKLAAGDDQEKTLREAFKVRDGVENIQSRGAMFLGGVQTSFNIFFIFFYILGGSKLLINSMGGSQKYTLKSAKISQ